MKKQIRKMIAAMLVLAMAVTMLPSVAVYAEKGTNEGSEIVIESPDSWVSIYNGWDTEFDKVSGVTYDKKTNTLTLKNYKNSNAMLYLNDVGDDFSIKVSGTNEVKGIRCSTSKYGGSIRFTGTGTLTVNKNREEWDAIWVYGRAISTAVKVDSGVILKVYKNKEEGASAITVEGKDAKAISITGISAYVQEGPYDAYENEWYLMPYTVYDCKFDKDANAYAAFDEGDGYRLFRKDSETAEGVPYLVETNNLNGQNWISKEEAAGCVQETSYTAYLEGRGEGLDLASKDEATYGIWTNWDENRRIIYKAAGQLSNGENYVVFAEETSDVENLPEGYTYMVAGQNYATRFCSDLVMISKPAISKATAKANGLTVTWKAVSGAKGYEVRYSTSSKMTGAWTQELSSSKKSVSISNLKSKVKVYVQVRAYTKDSNGNKIYTEWSAAKSATTK